MEAALRVTVVPTVATRKAGMEDLLEAVTGAMSEGSRNRPRSLNYGEDVEAAVKQLAAEISRRHPALAERYPERWLALKVLEGDRHVLAEANITDVDSLTKDAVRHLKEAHGEDLESLMADVRYSLAAGLTREVLKRPAVRKTDLTEPFADWLDGAINGPLTRWIEALTYLLHGPDWLVSLMTKGVVAGVGSVLVFVPVIFAMMFFITFLEGSGYMARAAFVMDKAMHAIGLHGKSFIPMILGFGCNVPAIYATRTLESWRDRVLTALLIPLMSCGARLPVYVLFVGVFFPGRAGTVIWSLYVVGIALAIVMGVIFKKTLFRGDAPAFIMELPPYRMPSLKSLGVHTWEKGKHFLFKAGTYILAVSVFVWFLLNLPWGVENKRDSYLGQAGQVVAPALAPLGFGNWEAASSLITGVIAKEIVVGTMGEIYAPQAAPSGEPVPTLGEDLKEIVVSFGAASRDAVLNVASSFTPSSFAIDMEAEAAPTPLKAAVGRAFTPLTAVSFMIFVLLYMPCVVVAIAMRQEFGGWKWFGVAFAYQTALAWGMALLVHQGGRLLGLGG